jgi:hypothetical protein
VPDDWAVQLLHPHTTLQLCFVAVSALREAVTCYDIISWALDAQLPFLELPDIACQCLSGMLLLRVFTMHIPAQTATPLSCIRGLVLQQVCTCRCQCTGTQPMLCCAAVL